jgi:hypothetical protein
MAFPNGDRLSEDPENGGRQALTVFLTLFGIRQLLSLILVTKKIKKLFFNKKKKKVR